MNKGNNVLVCIGLLILIYFLFNGAVIEGITTYMKGECWGSYVIVVNTLHQKRNVVKP